MLATVLLNPRRNVEYIAALNQPNRLLLGYCFRRVIFPGWPFGRKTRREPTRRGMDAPRRADWNLGPRPLR